MKKYIVVIIVIIQLLDIYKCDDISNNDFCAKLSTIDCNPNDKYRPIDNRCNNLQNPFVGAANTKFKRFLPPRYGDSISSVRKSITGADLPNTRLISLKVFDNKHEANSKLTQAFASIAQMVAHDISNVLKAPVVNGCCEETGQFVSNPDPSCMAILIPDNDTVHVNQTCMDFTRSLTDLDMYCPNYPRGPAQQINGATHSLDLSPVYGTSNEQLKALRSFKNGEMRVEERDGNTWPPQTDPHENVCFNQRPAETCYMSGDSRINQNTLISIIQVLFLREHNRIAKELSKLNPQLTDEILFQEARRINIAKYQNIVYYGWFSAIVGPQNVGRLGLYYQESGGNYSNDYSPNIEPVIFNEFSAAMFRLPHSLIVGYLRKLSETGKLENVAKISDSFFRPQFIEENGSFDSLIRGITSDAAESFDRNYDDEIRQFLFRHNKTFGMDLKAIDIQRGRDHGVGTYNELRLRCGLPRAKQWSDFRDLLDQKDIDNLMKVYDHPDDVDFNVGTSLEKPLGNGILIGYTYVCMVKYQVKYLRAGDRFWFENNDPAAGFTPEQLTELRKSSYPRLVCDNTQNIQKLPKNPFYISDNVTNYLVDCSEFPSFNMTLFKI